ncbi:hypothetical protein C8Q80DRAFT_1121085 [Daedaleopsis nitida]|nr:hypothetical protein C8Q80DRAFT_1121085 [Daedaleopsis nitida]
MKVIKLHFLGDYVHFIRHKGTTDSYTTQISESSVQGEHEHRRLKVRRKRTNFINPDQQMVKMDMRESAIRRIVQELVSIGVHVPGVELQAGNSDTHAPESTGTTPILPSEHHSVVKSERNVVYLCVWQLENPDDDAVQGFACNLRAHLIERMVALYPGDNRDSPSSFVAIDQDRIYEHATMQINFTTYDLQRDQDIIHANTSKTGVMVYTPGVSAEEPTALDHPWSYTTVLRIFHANIVYVRGPGLITKQRVDFVWLRWHWADTFGFVDPSSIIRGSHYIPAFHHGRTPDLLRPSTVRDACGDWTYYYVNR